MENNPLISVIVPVYRVEEYLPRCVDSLLNQSYPNLEIILVDDGSPDGSGALCDEYAARDSRIRVVHKENGGLSSARNAGLDIARGDYIGFVDSDDWVEPETYGWLLDMALSEDVKLVCAGRYDFSSWSGQRTQGLCPKQREVISGRELARRIFLWDNVDSAACDKLYHRSLFETVRYPVGVVSEDVSVTYRLALKAHRVGMLDKPVYNYFHRDGSITTSGVSPKAFQPSGHTERILAEIREECPELVPAATYFHVRHLVYICQIIDLEGKETLARYRDDCRVKRRQLRRFLPYILTSPIPTARERLTWLTISLGCYAPLQKLYHLVKKPGRR